MRKTLLCLMVLAIAVSFCSFAYAETPYEVIIETVTTGMEYRDIPAVEAALNAITLPAINCTVKIMNIGIAQHAQKISMMIAGNEKIDLVMAGLTLPMVNMVADGMLLPLGELLDRLGSDITALFGTLLQAGEVGGILYAIPADAYTAQSGGLVYNQQMAQEMGIAVPEKLTAEDLTTLFAQLKTINPNMYGTSMGTGEYSVALYQYNLENYGSSIYAFGVTFDQYANTEIVNFYASEQYREYCLLIRNWLENGYIPDNTMTSGIVPQVMMATGQVFSKTSNCSPLEKPTQQNGYPFPIEMAEITKAVNSTSGLQERMWGIPVTSENPEKAMQFLNLMFNNAEVANLLSNGIEGIHYQQLGGGVIAVADDAGSSMPGYGRVFSRFGNQMQVYQYQPATDTIYTELEDFNENSLTSLTLGYSFNSEVVATEIIAINAVIAQYAPPLECGMVEDVDTALAQFNEQLVNAGIDRVIDANRAQLEAWFTK